ncbi:MAG: hypothetical protein GXN93_03650 [Candidatus Diapherotrites archaeon]|nr:hypothetical protein [Candidatus Diapherotrites archaeon]
MGLRGFFRRSDRVEAHREPPVARKDLSLGISVRRVRELLDEQEGNLKDLRDSIGNPFRSDRSVVPFDNFVHQLWLRFFFGDVTLNTRDKSLLRTLDDLRNDRTLPALERNEHLIDIERALFRQHPVARELLAHYYSTHKSALPGSGLKHFLTPSQFSNVLATKILERWLSEKGLEIRPVLGDLDASDVYVENHDEIRTRILDNLESLPGPVLSDDVHERLRTSDNPHNVARKIPVAHSIHPDSEPLHPYVRQFMDSVYAGVADAIPFDRERFDAHAESANIFGRIRRMRQELAGVPSEHLLPEEYIDRIKEISDSILKLQMRLRDREKG